MKDLQKYFRGEVWEGMETGWMWSCQVGVEKGVLPKHWTRRSGGFILVLRYRFVGIEGEPNRNSVIHDMPALLVEEGSALEPIY